MKSIIKIKTNIIQNFSILQISITLTFYPKNLINIFIKNKYNTNLNHKHLKLILINTYTIHLILKK